MKLARRKFLHLAAGVAALPAMPRIAKARAYPARPVRIVVAFPAGGSSDIVARLAGQWLSERLGQAFIIENRPGAGTNVGTEAVVRSAPDGYTLLLAVTPNAIAATLYEKLNFDFIRDVAPVASIARAPNVMVVNPSIPVKTVSEFIAYAKANPGKVNMASAGLGSANHVFGALFTIMAGIELVHVPYRGEAPALTGLLGGQVQVMFPTVTAAIQQIQAGKLRALAVTTAARSDLLPDVPVVADVLTGYEASTWYGICAPRNTPAEIIEKLNKATNAALADPKTKAELADLGAAVLTGSPADFGKLIADDTEKWGKVIRTANIKPE